MAVTWICPACRRKVPGYIDTCHCGALRATAERAVLPPEVVPARGAARARRVARDVPWQVWLALGVMGLALVGGVAWLIFVPPKPPEPMVPLLGYVERVPTPKPTRTPAPPSAPVRVPRRAPARPH